MPKTFCYVIDVISARGRYELRSQGRYGDPTQVWAWDERNFVKSKNSYKNLSREFRTLTHIIIDLSLLIKSYKLNAISSDDK